MEAVATTNRELDLFAHARNWKQYWRRTIAPFIKGSVLEVGAGIGANTELLSGLTTGRWVCLEPDPDSADRIRDTLPLRFETITGTLESLPPSRTFDTIIYIDVLEHIERDRAELEQASTKLNPGGHLVVLCPAHQLLYTPFDEAIGHFRRYSRRQLVSLQPPGAVLREALYLDSVGMILSLGNRLLLKQHMPALRQILFWDKVVVPVSRFIDPFLGRNLGKTVVVVWRKE